jgi:PAS domain S-box-containing protein
MFEPASRNPKTANVNEVQALAEAVLEAARVAGLGVTVSFDDGVALRHIYVNDPASAILGYPTDELIGGMTAVTFAPEERERMLNLASQWRRGEIAPSLVESVIVRKDGRRVPVEIAFSVVPLAGEPAIVTFFRDISQRKEAEEGRRRSEHHFRQLIEAAPDAIGVYRHGRLVYVNPALVALFARPFEELVDREATDFVHPEDRHVVQYDGVASGAAPPQTPHEYRILHPDGRTISVETTSISIEYEGRPAVLGFTRDTTERKLFQAQLALNDRIATLGMLAAGVAHEINNPLAYATLNVEKLVRHVPPMVMDDASDGLAPAIAAARDGLARVATIVHDLQSLSMPTSADRWPVDVKEVLESALNVAMHAIRGRARIVRRYTDVPPLRTDPTRLGQIVLNLVFNAAQSFEGPDETRNMLCLGIEATPSGSVVITVADNGPGIPTENLARIFEPFFTTKTRGTGLGLAISQTLAISLGSKLEVESEVGGGTKFTLQLAGPLSREDLRRRP